MRSQKKEDPLEQTLNRLASSVTNLESTLSAQKSIIEELVKRSYSLEDNNWKNESSEIKSEIISLKSLFLSRYKIL